MKAKRRGSFVPVASLAVAGLVGVAYAQCYGYMSYMCANTGDIVGHKTIQPCNQSVTVQATQPWYVFDYPDPMSPGQSGWGLDQFKYEECTGPAAWLDCNTQRQTDPNYPSDLYYYGVDTTAQPDCSS
jgi:hypothetical protein